MNAIRNLLAGALLSLFSVCAWADTVVSFDSIEQAAKRPTDLSRQFLVMMFGDVVTNPLSTNRSMVGELFFVFNGIVMAVAVVYFLTVTLRHVVKVGHKGKVFSGAGSAMGPVTTAAGFISLVPTVSGWSLSQLLFLWAASVMGVGSANVVTDRIVDLIDEGYSLVVQPVAPDTVNSARAIYEMNLCMHSINSELTSMYQRYGKGGTPLMDVKSVPDGYEIGNGSALCGSARIPEPGVFTRVGDFFVNTDTSAIFTAQKNALTIMQNSLNDDAGAFVNATITRQQTGSGKIPDAETAIQSAARVYEDSINQAVKNQGNGDTLASTMTAQIKKNGWLALGAWYQTIATANTKMNDAVQLKPVLAGMSGVGELGSGEQYATIQTAYHAQLQNSPYTPPMGTQGFRDTLQATDASSPDAVFIGIFHAYFQKMTNDIATAQFGSAGQASGQMNPLLKMKIIGDYTMGGAQAAFAAFTTAKVATAMGGEGFWGKVINAFSFNAVTGIAAFLDAVTPLVYFLLLMLFGVGVSLSIYLPLIPFIFWIAAAANWFASVFVGCTGGTLWAATHLGTEESTGSRSAYGYIFLIDAMLRPLLMVFGFVFASLIVIGVGTLTDMLFGPAIANVQTNSSTGIATMVFLLLAYARICTTSVTRAFALQVTMPDYIISWLGGREAANILGGLAESTKSVFAGFSNGLQRTPGIKSNDKTGNNNKGDEDGIQ
ncbi:DotA/TraY family protein [Enterobacteriaceae bacterium H11S18]|uniref:DotA/TraY family protein n=1 Tax=Dryocola clanedunensis TaxID=2925396 RepID=UPI0022F0512B|nr:DotA/TraY family protein [Dryocola clanedunensis]MCT4709253.1 DotA/TraY family protein [Dryocola clanedunensis]